MKLYGYYRSSASYRIRIMLNYKGLDFENVAVRLDRGEHRADEFRRINTQGFVPALDVGAAVLAQSPAIAEYIEELYPEPPLLPADAIGRARVREIVGIVGCDIHPIQNLRILTHLRSEFGQDDESVSAWCRRWIGEGFAVIEKLAAERSTEGRYVFGDSLTLGDVWLIPQVFNARRFGLDLAPFPTIAGIDAHCQGLEAFAKAHPARQPDAVS
ncbi:MAG: maleylacetoacetate isomerase [Gammaproteobacteria bacterium]|nr:maleylacetoacetate isomerase [Gammaproteobacteria bacterium]MDH4253046.1 maleylacetoacetate isomerase [Gammaproteobacteria bacterium]MDH5308532.1 maleylacetoacetate isomerase [Gammaproteobacteria bacterium]